MTLDWLKNNQLISGEKRYNSIRVNFCSILLWFLFCRSMYFFFLILPFVCKMAVCCRKSSIPSPKWPLIRIKNILFDSSRHGASIHVFLKTIRIYLPFHFLATKIKSSKKHVFSFFILPPHVFYLPISAAIWTYPETLPVCREYLQWYAYAIKKNLANY